MQFYVELWLETGLKLSDLGKWEQENPYEYESYMSAYVRRIQRIVEARKKAMAKSHVKR